MPPFVETKNLTFFHRNAAVPALDTVDLAVKKGDRFGLFGPNGAGKTTLLSLICGLRKPDSGSVTVDGAPVTSVKQQLGFVPQDFAFYSELSPMQNLAFFAAWSNVPKHEIVTRSEETLRVLGLYEVRHKPVSRFSGGMKRRVNLAIGIIHRPALLILDEPTTGVDVQSRHAIIGHLKLLNAQGMTLIYTSHHLREAEDLCNEVALIDNGKIIAGGTLDALKQTNAVPDLEALFLKLTGRAYRD